MTFKELEDNYELELTSYEIVPIYTWRKKLQMTAGEVQLIALLGVLAIGGMWFM